MLILGSAGRSGLYVSKYVGQCRTKAVIAFPKGRMPFYQKVAHGLTIAFGVLFTPVYIAVNFKNYRAPTQ